MTKEQAKAWASRREERLNDAGGGPMPRGAWGVGPWNQEPDRVEWISPEGYPLLICRSYGGALCGYVGVSPEHPWHEKYHDDIDPSPDCHGGLTYSGASGGRIKHESAHPEVRWFGFDCSHHDDFSPASEALLRILWIGASGLASSQVYRDLDYVAHCCFELATQAAAAVPKVGTLPLFDELPGLAHK